LKKTEMEKIFSYLETERQNEAIMKTFLMN